MKKCSVCGKHVLIVSDCGICADCEKNRNGGMSKEERLILEAMRAVEAGTNSMKYDEPSMSEFPSDAERRNLCVNAIRYIVQGVSAKGYATDAEAFFSLVDYPKYKLLNGMLILRYSNGNMETYYTAYTKDYRAFELVDEQGKVFLIDDQPSKQLLDMLFNQAVMNRSLL